MSLCSYDEEEAQMWWELWQGNQGSVDGASLFLHLSPLSPQIIPTRHKEYAGHTWFLGPRWAASVVSFNCQPDIICNYLAWYLEWEWPPQAHVWTLESWEGLGDVALLEEAYHCGHVLRFQKPMPFPVSTSCLLHVDWDMSPQPLFQCHTCRPVCHYASCHDGHRF